MTLTAPTPQPTRSEGSPPPELPPLHRRPVFLVVAAMLALELSMAARYGIHRDELYFIICGRHLSWGYVDQPPMVPAIARVITALFGPSAFWLRVPTAIAAAATVVICAAITRRLGGGRAAQIIAALAAATSAQAMAAFHLLSTASFDIFFWSVLSYLLLRLLSSADERWWLAIGAVAGVSLLNKLNPSFLVAGWAAGLLLTEHRRLLRSRWFAGGAAIAVALASPDIVWNATHHWAQLAMMHSLHQENSTLGASLGFIPDQIIVVGPVLAPLWIPGVRRLLHHATGRPLAIGYLASLALYVLSGGKPYYLAGAYYVLFAGGALRAEERMASANRPRLGRRIAVMIVGGVAMLPLTLPVLPEAALAKGTWEGNINKDLSATVGWPQMTAQISRLASTLPPASRQRLVIFTGDYGAAGAVDVYGPRFGLPPAISGHNTFWWWGPGRAPNDSTTIAVNLPRPYLLTIFRSVTPAGAVQTPHDVWTEEGGDPIYLCTQQYRTWAQAWPAARHYG